MNIIRTTAVELSEIPAIAYKQKISAGGAGVKILRLDRDASAVFTIDRRSGEAVAYGPYDAELFTDEAVAEALELTSGLPYSARGKLHVTVFEEAAGAEDVDETETEKIDMVDSDEYKAIVSRYANEKGKLNYSLMNKDFIQFASKSKVVAEMVANNAGVESVLLFIIKSRATFLSGKKESLSDQETAALIETLDEIDPRSAFKELSAYLKRLMARK
ncbi:MAG: hypothetical protein FWF05_06665 [Oscillospiraceae bacterium]|nr:hypothetical protein [Oscillospiraceae bacterium]